MADGSDHGKLLGLREPGEDPLQQPGSFGEASAAPESVGDAGNQQPYLVVPTEENFEKLRMTYLNEALPRAREMGADISDSNVVKAMQKDFSNWMLAIGPELGWSPPEVEGFLSKGGYPLPDATGATGMSYTQITEARLQMLQQYEADKEAVEGWDKRTQERRAEMQRAGMRPGEIAASEPEDIQEAKARLAAVNFSAPMNLVRRGVLLRLSESARELKEQNPDEFEAALRLDHAYHVPGLETPGAAWLKPLVGETGAELVLRDMQDPVAWLTGGPIKGTILGAVTLGLGGMMVKTMRAAGKTGAHTIDDFMQVHETALDIRKEYAARNGLDKIAPEFAYTPDELDELVVGINRGLDDLSRDRPKAKPGDMAPSGGLTPAGKQKSEAEKAQQAIRVGGELLQRRLRTQELAKIAKYDKRSLPVLDKMNPYMRDVYLSLRMNLVTDMDELKNVESILGQKYDLPSEWFNRDILKVEFVNPKTGESLHISGGVVADALANPGKYIPNNFEGDLLSGGKGRMRLLGTAADRVGRELGGEHKALSRIFREQVDAIRNRNEVGPWRFVGRSPLTQRYRKAIELEYKDGAPELSAVGATVGKIGARSVRAMLQNTGAQDILVRADQIRQTMIDTRLWELKAALGGQILKHHTGYFNAMESGGLGWKARGAAIADRPFIDGGIDATRDLNDAIYWRLGNAKDREFINRQRLRDGRPMVEEAVEKSSRLAEKSDEYATNLRVLLDDLHDEASKLGQLSPHQYLLEYVPRMRQRVARGVEEYGEAFNDFELYSRLIDEAKTSGNHHAVPFYQKMRVGDIDVRETNMAKLLDGYIRTMYDQAYLQPVIDDLLKLVDSPSASIGFRDRSFLRNWLAFRSGQPTAAQMVTSARLVDNSKRLQMAAQSGTANAAVIEEALLNDPLFVKVLDDPRRLHDMSSKYARFYANIMYAKFLSRPGSALRNLTQKFLSTTLIGGGLPMSQRLKNPLPYFMRGRKEWANNPQAREAFLMSAVENGWIRAYNELVDTAMDEANRLFGMTKDIQEFLTYGYRMADLDNRAMVWLGANAYFDEALEHKSALEWMAAKMRPQERAVFKRALADGDVDLARRTYNDFVVNETQWLYHSYNRLTDPLKTSLGIEGQHSFLSTLIDTIGIFLSWGQHFGEAMVHAGTFSIQNPELMSTFTRVASKPGRLAGSKIGGRLGGATANASTRLASAVDYQLSMATLGVALDYAGQIGGLGLDMDRWLLGVLPREYARRWNVPGVDVVDDPRKRDRMLWEGGERIPFVTAPFTNHPLTGSTPLPVEQAQAAMKVLGGLGSAVLGNPPGVDLFRSTRELSPVPIGVDPLLQEGASRLVDSVYPRSVEDRMPFFSRAMVGLFGVPQPPDKGQDPSAQFSMSFLERWLEGQNIPLAGSRKGRDQTPTVDLEAAEKR